MNALSRNYFSKFWMFLFCLVLLSTAFSCEKTKQTVSSELGLKKQQKTILIQPFKDISKVKIEKISEEIRKIYPNIQVLEPIDFPKNAFYQPRNRYRADSIIKSLQKNALENQIILALTSIDISVTKGKNVDFGVMGLGYRPGRACIASSFRLKHNGQFFKVAIHELGHTQGLQHCPEKTCFMRDAEGGNPTDEETDFCLKCKNFLKTKNWNFN